MSVISWDIGVFNLASDAEQFQQDKHLRKVEITEEADLERTLIWRQDRVYNIYASWKEVNEDPQATPTTVWSQE